MAVTFLLLQALSCSGTSTSDKIAGPQGADTGWTQDSSEFEAHSDSGDARGDSNGDESASGETGDSLSFDSGDTGTEDDDWPVPSGYRCWTLYWDGVTGGSYVASLNPATGTGTIASTLDDEELAYDSSSLGREGDTLYTCRGGGERLATVSITTGVVTYFPTGCWSAAAWPGSVDTPNRMLLLGRSAWTLRSYDDLSAAEADVGTTLYGAELSTTSRITVADDLVYGAWHSTSEVRVFDLVAGGTASEMPLEGRDGWIWGLAVIEGTLLVMAGNQLEAFDAATGTSLGARTAWVIGGRDYFYGLACEADDAYADLSFLPILH